MQTKICTQCEIEKEISEFNNQKLGKFGVTSVCKSCKKLNNRNKYLLNKNKINERTKKWKKENKDKIKKISKNWYLKNKEKLLKQNHEYYITHKNEYKELREKNKSQLAKYQREFRLKNINHKIAGNLRTRITKVLKGINKSGHTLDLLGCSIEFFRNHLEKQFTDRMTWENYGKGGWVIDHIKPCCSFDLSKVEELKECEHYTNKQPLWEIDNLKKSGKYAL
jgi:hypothetical protein